MLTHDYTLICEHARLEMGGKWTLIGLIPNGIIATPQIPFPLPTLTFYQVFNTDGPSTHKFTARLSELTTGNLLAQASGQMNTVQAGPVIMPVALGNLQFRAFGTYTWSMDIEGQPEPFLTQFNVVLVQQNLRVVPPPPPTRPN